MPGSTSSSVHSFGFNDAAPKRVSADSVLLQAIRTGDKQMFEKAIDAGADVDHGNGLPLALAAELEDYVFLRALVMQGADIHHALQGLEAGLKKIPRNYVSVDDDWGIGHYVCATAEGKIEYARLTRAQAQLSGYQKTFLESINPIENMRLQAEMLKELQDLRRLLDPEAPERTATLNKKTPPRL